MALKAGRLNDFTDSMAAAMERALAVEWQALKGVALPTVGEAERRLLFVAIAQGVVKHLQEHAEDAFRVHSVEVTQDSGLVTSTGRTTTPGLQLPVTVTQDAAAVGAPNRVRSIGEGRVEILATGVI